MAKYKAVKRGYDGNTIQEVGSIFEFKGEPSDWMELVEESKPASKHKAEEEEAAPKHKGHQHKSEK